MNNIGIIAAMDSEVTLLKNAIENRIDTKIAGSFYHSGKIGKHNVVLTRCGIGKVSAALSAQVMISQFKVDCLFNTGCAGALAPGLNIGDFVISTSTAEWDIDIEAIGLPRGYVSALDSTVMKADDKLSLLMKSAIPSNEKVQEGLIVSGDQFVHTDQQRQTILKNFPTALCTEMEGGAIGHVCTQNNIPFCIIRCMSDTADGDSSVNFEEFSAMAGEKSGANMIRLLNA
ncbi:MAG: 5'-methylthioadenosine/adenosylhomocysteine nucleosidase [Paludibacteraceae bacterium]|nr:5'-methylthioadenosine/adenosylhomocysteine nucleosidase [Paludibacteraceae bacterium]